MTTHYFRSRFHRSTLTVLTLTIAAAAVAAGNAVAQTTFSSTDTPLPVPSVGTSGTATSTITIGPGFGTIDDADVNVDISHTFSGDLELRLQHVDTGTTVLLRDNTGGSSDDIVETYDDEGNAPVEPLSAFDGEDSAGMWELEISDIFGGDSGTLNSWDLVFMLSPTADVSSAQLIGSLAQTAFQGQSYQFQLLSRRLRGIAAAMAGGDGFDVASLPAPSRDVQFASYAGNSSSLFGDDASPSGMQVRGQNSPIISNGWDGWATGYGIGGQVIGSGGIGDLQYGNGGTQLGMYRVTDSGSLVGLFGGYGYQDVAIAGGSQAFVNSGQLGAFLYRCNDGGSYYIMAGSGAYDDYDTSRGAVRGNYNGWQSAAYVERGVTRCINLDGRQLTVTPNVALQHVWVHQEGHAETGAGAATVDETDAHSLRGMVGAKLQGGTRCFMNGSLVPTLRAHWMHEFLDTTTIVNGGVGVTNFSTNGLSLGRDWAVVGTGLTYNRGSRASLYANYDLMVNDRQTFHIGSGGLMWAW